MFRPTRPEKGGYGMARRRMLVVGVQVCTLVGVLLCSCSTSTGGGRAHATTSTSASGGSSSPSTTPGGGGTRGHSGGATTTTTRAATTTTTRAAVAACTLPLTHDPYEGFHVAVPSGWDLSTLDGEIVVSANGAGTEDVVVIPALETASTGAASFFSTALAEVTRQVRAGGSSISAAVTGGADPHATLTLEVAHQAVAGSAGLVVRDDETAHGGSLLEFVASWAPAARLAAVEGLLNGIANCYGPERGTLFQVVSDQAFTYPIPLGWKAENEGPDTIEIADGDVASASYLLTLAPLGSGIDTPFGLLSWVFSQIQITIGSVVSSVKLPDQVTSTGSTQGQEYVEFTGTASGKPVHGIAYVLTDAGNGVTSGVVRLGVADSALWNSVNGALITIMGGIQHNFTQDLQEFANLSRQWQSFDQQVAGFDDALNGVDIVHDQSTGQTFEAPYEAYDPGGPDGPGYYDEAGNKLQIETP